MVEQELKFSHSIGIAILLLGVPLGIAFMSPSLTGNAIGNLNNTTSSAIGVGITILSIVLGFALSRN